MHQMFPISWHAYRRSTFAGPPPGPRARAIDSLRRDLETARNVFIMGASIATT